MTDASKINDALASNYILVDLTIQSWAGNKTDKAVSADVIAQKGASKDSGKFVKNLLASASAELDEVKSRGQGLRHFLYERTLPWAANSAGAKRGERLLATSQSIDFMADFQQLQKEYEDSVRQLVSAWPTRVHQAIVALGALADANDYPDAAEIAGYFTVTLDMRPIPAVADYSRLNVPVALAEQLALQHTEAAQAQLDGAMANLRERLCGELERMHTHLGKHANGERTRLHATLVTNLQGLARLARSMNVGDNPKLEGLITNIERSLLQAPVEAYKEDPNKAGVVAEAAKQLLSDASLEEVWTFTK